MQLLARFKHIDWLKVYENITFSLSLSNLYKYPCLFFLDPRLGYAYLLAKFEVGLISVMLVKEKTCTPLTLPDKSRAVSDPLTLFPPMYLESYFFWKQF